MVATVPECPHCGAPMRLTSSLTSAGLVQDWMCTDSTCTCILTCITLAVRDDILGAPIEALMRAPVTPQGGGSGNGRSRREQKPGDREATLARMERRYLDQDGAGGRDREVITSPVTQVVTARIDAELAAEVAEVQGEHGLSMSAIVRLGLVAYVDRVHRDGYPCPQCQFWVHDEDKRCPQCGG